MEKNTHTYQGETVRTENPERNHHKKEQKKNNRLNISNVEQKTKFEKSITNRKNEEKSGSFRCVKLLLSDLGLI